MEDQPYKGGEYNATGFNVDYGKSSYPTELTQPVVADGYNPLEALRVSTPPTEPKTIKAHAEWMVLRSAQLSRWSETPHDGRDVILETLARMEDNIRGIRSLMNQEDPPALGPLASMEAAREAHEIMVLSAETIKPRKRVKRWSPFI